TRSVGNPLRAFPLLRPLAKRASLPHAPHGVATFPNRWAQWLLRLHAPPPGPGLGIKGVLYELLLHRAPPSRRKVGRSRLLRRTRRQWHPPRAPNSSVGFLREETSDLETSERELIEIVFVNIDALLFQGCIRSPQNDSRPNRAACLRGELTSGS